MVEGTTFIGVYGIVDGIVQLTSSDFGEGVAKLRDPLGLATAEQLLRAMAEDEISRTDTPFMPDHRPF